MHQEWNSAQITPPHRGQILRDYALLGAKGEPVQLTDFRGRWNLVLILLPQEPDTTQAHLLSTLRRKSEQVREFETRVLVVTRPEHLPTVVNLAGDFLVLSDQDGRTMAELGSVGAPVIYILDKLREVVHRFDAEKHVALPTAEEILGWMEFTSRQCPECHPPAWPADEVA
jgi:peroxiredoxin